MVIREDRDRLAQSIAAFMRGEVDNIYLFDEILSRRSSSDQTVRLFESLIWHYCDLDKPHPISVSATGWKMFRRMIAFLRTDMEYAARWKNSDMWPFADRLQIIASRVSVRDLALPLYDPTIHGLPIHTRAEIWRMRIRDWAFTAIFVAVLFLIIHVLK